MSEAYNSVHRQILALASRQQIEVHCSSEVLNIDNMREQLQRVYAESKFEIWYTTVNSIRRADYVMREIIVVGTGEEMPPDARYHLGSVVSPDGTFVWHFFSPEMKRAA